MVRVNKRRQRDADRGVILFRARSDRHVLVESQQPVQAHDDDVLAAVHSARRASPTPQLDCTQPPLLRTLLEMTAPPQLQLLPTMVIPPSFPAGFYPVPRDPLAYLPSPEAALLDASAALDLHLNVSAMPVTDIINQAKDYLKDELSIPIWNHSHRAYLFGELHRCQCRPPPAELTGSARSNTPGAAIAFLHLPNDIKYAFDPEGFYLACLFHDLGCTDKNIPKSVSSVGGRAVDVAFRFSPSPRLQVDTHLLAVLTLLRTKMSFEFWGAFTARQWLLDHGASSDLADSVAEGE